MRVADPHEPLQVGGRVVLAAADVEDRARLGVGQHPPPGPVLGELAGQAVGDRPVPGQVGGLPAQAQQRPGGDGHQDLRALPARARDPHGGRAAALGGGGRGARPSGARSHPSPGGARPPPAT